MFTFYIQDYYNTTEVTEPNGWRDIRSVLERDFKTHGMFFNYTEGTLKLGFICDGKTLLEAAFQFYGVDAFYEFVVDEDGSEIYRARMDFTTRYFDEDIFEIEVDTSTTEVLLKNRRRIKSVIDAAIDFEGKGISRTPYEQRMLFPAKKTNAASSLSNSEGSLDAVESIPGDSETWIWAQFGFNDSTSKEIQRTFTLESSVLDAYKPGRVMEFDQDVELEITIVWDIDFNITDIQSSGLTTGRVDLWLYYNEDSRLSLGFDTYAGTAPYAASNISLVGSETNYIVVPKGGRVWVEAGIRMNTVGTAEQSVQIDINTLTLEATDKKAITATNGDWYNAHDVLEKNLSMITGQFDFLYSDLLGEKFKGYFGDGCLKDLMLINGYGLRNIAGTDKTPEISFDEIVQNLDALEAIGYGVEHLNVPKAQGLFDVYWESQQNSPRRATIRVYEDITSWVQPTDTIIIKNSIEADFFVGDVSIDGAFYVNSITWTGTYSSLIIDITNSDKFYDLIFQVPSDATWFYNCALSSTGELQVREQLRLEHWTHFYSNHELIDLGVVEDYTEEPFEDAAFNSLEIGSSKYANDEDDPLTLEEFMTDSQWTIPIKNARNSLKKMLSWIGSPFLFQESRIQQFEEDTTKASRYDKDVFFAEKTPRIAVDVSATFSVAGKTLRIEAWAYENYLLGASWLTVTGATDPLNNKTYQVNTAVDVVHFLVDDTYQFALTTTPGATETTTCSIEYESLTDVVYYKAETDEKMTSSSGLTNSRYIVNQRRTIKRRLFNLGSFLKSVLSKKLPALIKNLRFDINGSLVTNTSDACTRIPGVDVTENANVNTDDLEDGIFKPNLIHFRRYICETDFQFILDAYRYSQAYTDINYGYIKVTSPRSGKVVTGYLMKLTRSPIDKIAEITILERNE